MWMPTVSSSPHPAAASRAEPFSAGAARAGAACETASGCRLSVSDSTMLAAAGSRGENSPAHSVLRVVDGATREAIDVTLRALEQDGAGGAWRRLPLNVAEDELTERFSRHSDGWIGSGFKESDVLLGLHDNAPSVEKPILVMHAPLDRTVRRNFGLDEGAQIATLSFRVKKPVLPMLERLRGRLSGYAALDPAVYRVTERMVRGVYLPDTREFVEAEDQSPLAAGVTHALTSLNLQHFNLDVGKSPYIETGPSAAAANAQRQPRQDVQSTAADLLPRLRALVDLARTEPASAAQAILRCDASAESESLGAQAARAMSQHPQSGEIVLSAYLDLLGILHGGNHFSDVQLLSLLLPGLADRAISPSTAIASHWQREALATALVRLVAAASRGNAARCQVQIGLAIKEADAWHENETGRQRMDFYKRVKRCVEGNKTARSNSASRLLYEQGMIPADRELYALVRIAQRSARNVPEPAGPRSLSELRAHLVEVEPTIERSLAAARQEHAELEAARGRITAEQAQRERQERERQAAAATMAGGGASALLASVAARVFDADERTPRPAAPRPARRRRAQSGARMWDELAARAAAYAAAGELARPASASATPLSYGMQQRQMIRSESAPEWISPPAAAVRPRIDFAALRSRDAALLARADRVIASSRYHAAQADAHVALIGGHSSESHA